MLQVIRKCHSLNLDALEKSTIKFDTLIVFDFSGHPESRSMEMIITDVVIYESSVKKNRAQLILGDIKLKECQSYSPILSYLPFLALVAFFSLEVIFSRFKSREYQGGLIGEMSVDTVFDESCNNCNLPRGIRQ